MKSRNSPRSMSTPIAHTRTNSITTINNSSPTIKAKINLNNIINTNSNNNNNLSNSNSISNSNTSSSPFSTYSMNTNQPTIGRARSELNTSPTFNSNRILSSKSIVSFSSNSNSNLTSNNNRPPFSTSPRNLSPTRLNSAPNSPPKVSRLNSSPSLISSTPFTTTTNTLRPPSAASSNIGSSQIIKSPPTVASNNITRSTIGNNSGGPSLRHSRSQSVTSTTSSTNSNSNHNNNTSPTFLLPTISNYHGNGNSNIGDSNSNVNGNGRILRGAASSSQLGPPSSSKLNGSTVDYSPRSNSSIGFVRNNSFASTNNSNTTNTNLNNGKSIGLGLEVRLNDKEKEKLVQLGVIEKERIQSEEKEKEAKIQRKIADLEITNSSLLTINASLERLKLKHTQEIRDLKRRLRESRLQPQLLPSLTHSLSSQSSTSPHTSDDEDDDDVEIEEKELPWEELVKEDEEFGNLANLVGNMLRRGKEAVIFRVELEQSRVLNAVEMEDREEGDDVEEVDDQE